MLTLLVTGCDLQVGSGSESTVEAEGESAMEHATKHLDPKYVCPMHPQIVRDEPADCPICGMDLVAKDMSGADAARPSVGLSAAVVQSMGVRTARVERGTLWKYIRTQGKVTYDDDRILQVHPRTAGWIENLYVRTDGVRVERKDDLADYFSPEILWAQQDYIETLEEGELESFGAGGAEVSPGAGLSGAQRRRYASLPKGPVDGHHGSRTKHGAQGDHPHPRAPGGRDCPA